MVRAWRYWTHCRSADRGPWLRQIARNEALRLAANRSWVDIDVIADVEDAGEESRRASLGVREEVRAAIAQLAKADRTLLYLHYWEQRPITEVSRLLDVPEGTVKVRLHRLRAQMRRILQSDPL